MSWQTRVCFELEEIERAEVCERRRERAQIVASQIEHLEVSAVRHRCEVFFLDGYPVKSQFFQYYYFSTISRDVELEIG